MTRFRVIVADDERMILEGYRIVIEGMVSPASTSLARLEEELFGSSEPGPPDEQVEVVCVTQGEAAVEAVRRASQEGRPFAAAFLDYRMPPGMSGLEAARAIRGIDGAMDIVIVSGFSGLEVRDIGREVPPSDRIGFLGKPFRVDELHGLLQSVRQRWQGGRQ